MPVESPIIVNHLVLTHHMAHVQNTSRLHGSDSCVSVARSMLIVFYWDLSGTTVSSLVNASQCGISLNALHFLTSN